MPAETLNAAGYNSGPVDGRFGPVTYRAVTRYQQAKRLFVDGIVGRQTGTALGIWGAAPPGGGGPDRRTGRHAAPAPSSGGATAGCAINTALRRGSSGARCAASSRG